MLKIVDDDRSQFEKDNLELDLVMRQWLGSVIIAVHYATGGKPMPDEDILNLPEAVGITNRWCFEKAHGRAFHPAMVAEEFCHMRKIKTKLKRK